MKTSRIFLLATALLVSGMAQADIVIRDAYVRAMPPGQSNTGAFMLIENQGDEDRALVSADSDAANVVELHTHRNVDGVMQMRQIPQIDLPAGATTELQPGGLHIMLIDVPERLMVDDEIRLTLVFDDGSEQTISAPVKSVMGGMMKHGEMKGHGEMKMHGHAKDMPATD
ncbi:copper chaperone PCu(A)C [Granulosicoccaceae sp. 1_MG-2023]|nr:copper chaperone PCu(A)C [Granulosicoccaceae sp. 1_MG-2023]